MDHEGKILLGDIWEYDVGASDDLSNPLVERILIVSIANRRSNIILTSPFDSAFIQGGWEEGQLEHYLLSKGTLIKRLSNVKKEEW